MYTSAVKFVISFVYNVHECCQVWMVAPELSVALEQESSKSESK